MRRTSAWSRPGWSTSWSRAPARRSSRAWCPSPPRPARPHGSASASASSSCRCVRSCGWPSRWPRSSTCRAIGSSSVSARAATATTSPGWPPACPGASRGRRTDAALRVLPGLVSGLPTRLDGAPDSPPIRLAPAATVPPILVGGMSEPAMLRAVDHGDGWFVLPVPPAAMAEGREDLAELAGTRGRPTPSVTASMVVAMTGDPALPGRDGLVRVLTDPDGIFGMPVEAVPETLTLGGPAEVAERIAAYGEAGAERVVVTLAAGDWMRQAEILAEAHARVG